MKCKKNLSLLFLSGCILTGCILWLSLRSVEIVATHQRNNYSDVLVKNFPFSDKGKINWWLENHTILKEKYNIPDPAKDGFFAVIFWEFGDGYKETDGYDRLCFDDMKSEINCIDKDSLMMVVYSKRTGMYFRLDSGKYYIAEDGKLMKAKYE